jgi:hypothetical protein
MLGGCILRHSLVYKHSQTSNLETILITKIVKFYHVSGVVASLVII